MIKLRNVTKIYRTGKVGVQALRNVSLEIVPGEFIAIMGPSGSGKSTLLHILGFLDRPDSGSYFLGKREINKLTDDELAVLRNRMAGFIFQQFHLLPRITVLENTALPLIYAGNRCSGEKAREKIKEVGLTHRASHRPNELSGGEQQRAAIARSLVNEPLLILADEPTGNLDTNSGQEIISILERLNQNGKTIIMVTHEKEIAEHAKRIVLMQDGEIVSDKKRGGEIISDRKMAGKPRGGVVAEIARLNQSKSSFATTIVHDSLNTHAIPFFSHEGNVSIDDILSESHSGVGKAEFADHFRQAASAIFSHKMRSILSMLGILIGVSAVIAMLAIGQGAKESISQRLAGLGSNLLVVRPGSHRMHGVALEAGTVTRFRLQDVKPIAKLPQIRRVSPSVAGRGQLVYGNKNWNTRIAGTGVDYAPMRAAVPVAGRFFTEEELRMRQKVAVLGTTVVKELFGNTNPIGAAIKINRINFQVIGVMPEKGAAHWRDLDDLVVIPVTTAMYRLLGKEYVDSIDVEVRDSDLMEQAQESVRKVIIKLRRLDKENEESFQIRNMAELQEAVKGTTRTMTWLLGTISAISLLVGGIGIMNIMLVSVTERTREIGIRKATGARRIDIMTQFLIESVVMTFTGGLAGIIFGSGIAAILAVFAGWAIKVSAFSIILATTFSVVVGITFGLWPARKASILNPIEALRYE